MNILTVKAIKNSVLCNTKYGYRYKATFQGPNGEIDVWGPQSFTELGMVRYGGTYQVAIDSKGKAHLVTQDTQDLPKLQTAPAPTPQPTYIPQPQQSYTVYSEPVVKNDVSIRNKFISDSLQGAKTQNMTQTQTTAPTPTVPAPTAPKAKVNQTPIQRSISAKAKLYEMCLIEAKVTATATLDNPTNEDIRAIATTYFIQVSREFSDGQILSDSPMLDDDDSDPVPF